MRDVKLSPAEIRMTAARSDLGNLSPSLPADRPASAATADSGKVPHGHPEPELPGRAQSSAATRGQRQGPYRQHEPELPRRSRDPASRGQRQGPPRKHEPELPGRRPTPAESRTPARSASTTSPAFARRPTPADVAAGKVARA